MKVRFESNWANHAARAVITLAGLSFVLLMRPDIYGYATKNLRAIYQCKIVSPRIMADYMRQNRVRKLQIGAGTSNSTGWLNTDIEPTEKQAYLDAAKALPFPDTSFHYIFGEHVIEHLTNEQGLRFLNEAHRVLAPGGKVRMVTPNLLQFVALFNEQSPEQKKAVGQYILRKLDYHSWADTPDSACLILNNEMRSWGHQFVYTPAMLRASFEKAGFTQIRQYGAGETDDPALKGLEMRPQVSYKDVNAYEAMAVEATR